MSRRSRAVDEKRLQLLLGEDDGAPTVVDGDAPVVEAGEYGLRVVHLSEDELIEAAQFLVATRVRQDLRVRDLRKAAARRHTG